MGNVVLNNGLKMPLVGYGVFRVPEGDDLAEAVKTAIAKGYRSIDTAQVYRNEESVGRGIRAANIRPVTISHRHFDAGGTR